MEKTALLIAGAGTIGTYVAKELLRLNCRVDVICLEDLVSYHPNLHYYKGYATLAYLQTLLADRHYDAIVDFLLYEDVGHYIPYYHLLTNHTDQLVFLSSYRVYANEQHPVTESAPKLCDVIKDDPDFFAQETYALVKSACEKFLLEQPKNWTVVRPVISFAGNRFDVVMHNNVITASQNGEVLPLPDATAELVAGLDWAGNVGKLIAHLLFKPECLGEAYTVSSGQNLKWKEIADYYTKTLGIKFAWIDTKTYIQNELPSNYYRLIYDRLFDRDMDCSKVLAATGLTRADFMPVQDAILYEIKRTKA